MTATIKISPEIYGRADHLPQSPAIFKQLTVHESLSLPDKAPGIGQILKIAAQASIADTKVIRTPSGTSLEGQILTGFKISIEGKITQQIEYGADTCSRNVHAVDSHIPFCTFVVLPGHYAAGTPVSITPYIQDIFIEPIKDRIIFANFLLLLDISVLCPISV